MMDIPKRSELEIARLGECRFPYAYGVPRILGFRYGYAGLASQSGYEPVLLSPAVVDTIHEHGGTLLGTSRGQQDIVDMVDTLMRWHVGLLFATRR